MWFAVDDLGASWPVSAISRLEVLLGGDMVDEDELVLEGATNTFMRRLMLVPMCLGMLLLEPV